MIYIIFHNRDMDGFCSGAICKLKYPDAKLIGWDYSDEIPDLKQLKRANSIIMIDVTFPVDIMEEIGVNTPLTVIDHHISFYNQVKDRKLPYTYIYQSNKAACEIGWEYLFPDKEIPYAITLIGRYDTWRKNEGNWENETLPFKCYCYSQCDSVNNFPEYMLNNNIPDYEINELILYGKIIVDSENMVNKVHAVNNSFVKECFNGLKVLCINNKSNDNPNIVLQSIWNPEEHDIMLSFCYNKYGKWSVSLRSIDNKPDVSIIAKERGGGGHRNAAGFSVNKFEDIFI